MDTIIRMFGVTRNNRLGFTLIELLVVIAIIGLLAGISIPLFLGQRSKAIASECKTNLSILYTLQEQYYAEYGRYGPWTDKTDPEEERIMIRYDTYRTSMLDYFPQFRPGDVNDLYFRYYTESFDKGQGFEARCEGYKTKTSKGITFKLTQDNELTVWK